MALEVYRIKNYVDLSGKGHNILYCLLADQNGYGVAVVDAGRERAEVRDLTPDRARAEGLLSLLSANLVTPCALRDVVEDWL